MCAFTVVAVHLCVNLRGALTFQLRVFKTRVLQIPRAPGVVPPTRPKKISKKSILAKGIHSKIAPPNFLVFRVLGRARSNPQGIHQFSAWVVLSSRRNAHFSKKGVQSASVTSSSSASVCEFTVVAVHLCVHSQ